MDFLSEIKLVMQTLLARKGRSFLTILGIMIGVAGVIIIIALGAGAQSLVLGQITKLGSNLIGVLPGKSNEKGPPAQLFGIQVTTLTAADAEAMADRSRLPHIVAVTAFANGSATVIWQSQNVDTNFAATQASYPVVQNVTMASGRFFDVREEQGGANVIVLGYEVAQELFGDQDALNQIVKIKNIPFRVIGVTEKQGGSFFMNQDDMVFIPLILGQQQLLGIHYLQFIRAKVDDPKNVQSTIDDVRQLLIERHHIRNPDEVDFSIRNMADAIKILTSITDALRLFLVMMAAISLLVGGIGIMNIMLVTVGERTREIGLRKAVGATNRDIRNQFLFEAGTVTALGGLAGIVYGILLSYLIAVGARYAGYDWAFVISPLSVALAIGVSVIIGLIFGSYPAFKAAKLDPIEALRYE